MSDLYKGEPVETPTPVLRNIGDVVTAILGGGGTKRGRRLLTYRVYNLCKRGLLTEYRDQTGTRMWDLREVRAVLAHGVDGTTRREHTRTRMRT